MFHDIPPEIRDRMRHLEALDRVDRVDGSHRSQRLRQVPPETGRFLALTALSAPAGAILEIGTSAGYSTLWLSLACRYMGRRVITFEMMENKIDMASETFKVSQVSDVVELVTRDARHALNEYQDVAFCFLDAEKEVYSEIYDALVPKMVSGGFLLADNVISHGDELKPMIDRALRDRRVDAVTVPIGAGVLYCRKL